MADIINTGTTVLDFWAPWCGHCGPMKERLQKIEASYEGKINFQYINIDEDMDIARQFKVRAIPTLVLLKDGQEAAKHTGEMTDKEIEEFLAQ